MSDPHRRECNDRHDWDERSKKLRVHVASSFLVRRLACAHPAAASPRDLACRYCHSVRWLSEIPRATRRRAASSGNSSVQRGHPLREHRATRDRSPPWAAIHRKRGASVPTQREKVLRSFGPPDDEVPYQSAFG